MKSIHTFNKAEDLVIDYTGYSFNEVYKEVKGQDVDIFLYKEKPGPHGIGRQFVAREFIGNAKQELTSADYYRAYDKLF